MLFGLSDNLNKAMLIQFDTYAIANPVHEIHYHKILTISHTNCFDISEISPLMKYNLYYTSISSHFFPCSLSSAVFARQTTRASGFSQNTFATCTVNQGLISARSVHGASLRKVRRIV